MPIDPITAGVASAVIADAIVSVTGLNLIGTRLRDARHGVGRDSASVFRPDGQRLAERLNHTIAAERLLPASAHARLRAFLRSVEMASITRQLCAAILAGQVDTYRSAIQDQLSLLLSLELELDTIHAAELAALLVECLTEDFQDVARTFRGRVPSPDAAWRELLLAHLSNIERILECLAGTRHADLAAIRRFADAFREQVRQRYRSITPPNIGGVRRVPIDAIYVSPELRPFRDHRRERFGRSIFDPQQRLFDDKVRHYALVEFASGIYRTVILAPPGTGKTTLVAKICHELAGRSHRIDIAGRHPVPIPVVLRDFASDHRERRPSIRDYIATYTSGRLQLDVPTGAFDYLLLTGGAIVLFDGLDELLDTSFRRTVIEDVESFCNRFSATPVLVTSRRVGYEDAPLAEDVFDAWTLTEFTHEQVETYATKWFSLTDDLTTEERESTTRAFMRESHHIRDLRSNPLMLALLCNIYRGESYLPRHLPDVYERCATMLFERWDRSRGITVPLPFEANLQPSLMAIAFWIYSNSELQTGVTESALVHQTANYLHRRRFSDEDLATAAAQEFVNYCRGRAWVLTDTGTTASGEPLYQFTHRTFLEYFAAAHLVRVHVTPERLWRALRNPVARGEWQMVASIAVQLIHRNVEDGADGLLLRLLSDARKAGPERRWFLLSFATRCLQFIVPSPNVTGAITDTLLATIDNDSTASPAKKRPGKREHGRPLIIDLLPTLIDVAHENVDCIVERMQLAALSSLRMAEEQPWHSDSFLIPFMTLRSFAVQGLNSSGCSAVLDELYAVAPEVRNEELRKSLDKLTQQYNREIITTEELLQEARELMGEFGSMGRI